MKITIEITKARKMKFSAWKFFTTKQEYFWEKTFQRLDISKYRKLYFRQF